MASSPSVSVIMPVFNGQAFVEQAVRSILKQTLQNLDLIVVDDASTDATPEILERLAQEDPRVIVRRLEKNSGASVARNLALDLANAPLVAIMDSDDVAYPERLARQKQVMDTDPELAVLGTSIRRVNAHGSTIRISRRLRDDLMLRRISRFHMPFSHPTLLIRTRALNEPFPLRYDPQIRSAQDYDLVAHLFERGTARNMPDVLLDYRVHPSQMSSTSYALQSLWAARIARRVQESMLSSRERAALEPFNRAYLDFERVESVEIIESMRRLIARDAAEHPSHAQFFMRYGAQLLATALRRSGRKPGALPGTLLRHGRDFVAPLAMRYLDIQRASK